MNKKETEGLLLHHLWEICYRAHQGTSFSPERRANTYVKDFSEQLEMDLKLLGENPGHYQEKFIEKFTSWMNAKGNCISSMITGGSNFPLRKAQKANNAENSAYKEFITWRERYFHNYKRVPTKSPEDDLELAEKKLERLTLLQMDMKDLNAEVRRCKITTLPELIAHLLEEGYPSGVIKKLDDGYGSAKGRFKIPGWQLSNNNATIKATEEKIKTMQTRIERKDTWEDIVFDGGYVTIEDDRVKIFHDEKPSKEIIDEIKSGGYRWSPNWVCWCRKHTGNAIYGLKSLSFLQKI